MDGWSMIPEEFFAVLKDRLEKRHKIFFGKRVEWLSNDEYPRDRTLFCTQKKGLWCVHLSFWKSGKHFVFGANRYLSYNWLQLKRIRIIKKELSAFLNDPVGLFQAHIPKTTEVYFTFHFDSGETKDFFNSPAYKELSAF